MKHFVLILFFAGVLQAQFPPSPARPINIEIDDAAIGVARALSLIPGTGVTLTGSCASGKCAVTINSTGGGGGGGLLGYTALDTPQTDQVTPPAGATWARVVAFSGGAGGRAGNANNRGGPGASGGGVVEKWCAVTAGTPVAYTVGAGGAGGVTSNQHGTRGGDTSFGTCVIVLGAEVPTGDSAAGHPGRNAEFPYPSVFIGQSNLTTLVTATADNGTNNTTYHVPTRNDYGGKGAIRTGTSDNDGYGVGWGYGGGAGGGGARAVTDLTARAGGTGGVAIRGGAGGNGAGWDGSAVIPCTAGTAPGGGGGGGLGVQTGSGGHSAGCAGARGEIRIWWF